MWLRAFCRDCNSRVGIWDDSYIKLYRAIRSWLDTYAVDEPVPIPSVLPISIDACSPGQIVRSVLGGMFALVPDLHQTHAELAATVLSGRPAEMPPDLDVMIAFLASGERMASAQRHVMQATLPLKDSEQQLTRHPSGLFVPPEPAVEPLPWAVIHNAPLTLLLAEATQAHRLPHLSLNHWLKESVEDPARSSNLLLPVVWPRSNGPMIGYDDFDQAGAIKIPSPTD